VAVGTRLNGRMTDSSMTFLNRSGNWLFTFLARTAYRTNVTDVCSGFFVWRRDIIDKLFPHLESGRFSLEMEMIARMAKLGFRCFSVPISYQPRDGRSSLRPVRDGMSILGAWISNLFWEPPEITPVQERPVAIPKESDKDFGMNADGIRYVNMLAGKNKDVP
jgi:hypothetical protein